MGPPTGSDGVSTQSAHQTGDQPRTETNGPEVGNGAENLTAGEAELTTEQAKSSDAVAIRIYPTPIVRENADPEVVRPLLIPFPQARARAGRLDRRGLITRLQLGAAVHLLRAYAALRDEGMTVKDAVPKI